MSLNRRTPGCPSPDHQVGSPFTRSKAAAGYIDCGIEARGGLLAGVELARICLAGLAASISIVPGEVSTADPITMVQVVTDHPVRACLASQYAGLGDQGGEVLRDGLGTDAGRRRDRGDLRHDRLSRGGRRTSWACWRRASRRRPRSSPRSPSACRVEPDHVTLLVGPDRQPGRRRAGRGPIRRDRLAQAGRAEVRPDAARLGPRHGPAAPGRRQRPRRDRPDQRRHPLRRAGRPLRDRRRLQPRVDRSPGPLLVLARSRRAVRHDLRAVQSTTSTRSIRTCSARPRSCSRTSRPAGSTPSASSTPGVLARSFNY